MYILTVSAECAPVAKAGGLTQLIAMQYGTISSVRAAGGLMDTVFDKDHSDRLEDQRNGYVFHHADEAGLESAMHFAIGLRHHHSAEFRQQMMQGMRCDFSCSRPAQDSIDVYNYIRNLS